LARQLRGLSYHSARYSEMTRGRFRHGTHEDLPLGDRLF